MLFPLQDKKIPKKRTSLILAENLVISFETDFLPFLCNNHDSELKEMISFWVQQISAK